MLDDMNYSLTKTLIAVTCINKNYSSVDLDYRSGGVSSDSEYHPDSPS